MPIHRLKILVVDDEEAIRVSLVGYLEDAGYDMIVAESGEAALSLLANDDADIAIVDLRLPGMDGNKLIKEIHRIKPKMKFLIYTGSPNYIIPEYLHELGIKKDDLIKKPVDDILFIEEAIQRISRGN